MIRIIGIGPSRKDITLRAVEAIEKSDLIIGYKKYIDSIEDLLQGKEIIKKGMGDEVARVEMAIQKSLEGNNVAIVSSGDPGIYGMANVFFQIESKYSNIECEVIPGVSASNYAASLLGAPLHDFATISLSDILTPLSEIERKIEYASKADLIIALYNPISKSRKEPFRTCLKILREIKDHKTPVGIVKTKNNVATVNITTLKELNEEMADMSTILIIGNSLTYVKEGYMITPRGYVINHTQHPMALDFYSRYIDNETFKGSNLECEYHPCHFEGQDCTFCYCPFYPCGDGSTGGAWIKDKGVWSCLNCKWIHEKSTVECLENKISEILKSSDDLTDNKKSLLKLRRECILKTNKKD